MMQHKGQVVTVPFPSGLMSTARSAAVMPAGFGVQVRNMLLAADGAGTKRNGFAKLGQAVSGGTVTGIFGHLYNGVVQVLASVDDGSIRKQNADGTWVLLQDGLDPAGVVRAVTFAGKLVLCNGTDDMLVWDGVSLLPVQEFVTDTSSGLAYVSATSFKINSEVGLYPVGRRVRARLNGVTYVEADVTAVSQTGAGSVVTVTLSAGVLTAGLDQVAYRKRPPRFAYLHAAHDRLWAMGQGAISAASSAQVDRSRVFYTNGTNDVNAWHAPETGVVPGINLADKAGPYSSGGDEVLAMAVKDGLTIFFGRQATQVWEGTDPTATGDFSWQKTLPVGLPHAGMLLELPNDVLFLNSGGARTLSRALQTEQLDVSDVGSEIDPTVQALVRAVLVDAGAFRQVRGCRMSGQGWVAVNLPGCLAVLQLTSAGAGAAGGPKSGWVLFDGLPGQAGVVGNLPDGRLVLAAGAQVYAYDEGRWDDDGTAFTCRWLTPWLGSGKGWANRYVEVQCLPGAAATLTLERYRDYDTFNPAVLTLPATQKADLWDTATWDVGQWDNGDPPKAVVRDHYVAEVMAYAVGQTAMTPLTIFGLKMYGISSR